MKSEEIELMVLNICADGQDALSMKIYKNGLLCRQGVGALPQLEIAGMSLFGSSEIFDSILKKMPFEFIYQPMNYEEQTPNGYIEYVFACFGASSNGNNGEGAEWTKSTGIRFKLDQQSRFMNVIVALLDKLAMDAAELTNEWYFDIVMNAKYKVMSSAIPKETLINFPDNEESINDNFENYINQMNASARSWSMFDFCDGKTYSKDGHILKGIIHQNHSSFRIDFVELDESGNIKIPERKWWEFW